MRRNQTARRNRRSIAVTHRAAQCESLETRRLLCGLSHEYLIEAPRWSDAIEQEYSQATRGGPEAVSIVWTNRGQASDNFSTTFGTSANTARAVVDAALSQWQRVISSFNRADGSSTLQVNISISGGGFGGAGAPAGTAPADGKPTTGSFTLGSGNNSADPNDANGWYLDPTPNDWSEYDIPIDAFSGSSSTATGPDLYSVASAELTHVLGLISDKNNNGGSWNGYRMETSGMAFATPTRDNTEGGGNFGRFWSFDGPTVDHLMTSYNSGDATDASWGNIIHTAGPGANINFNLVNWRTAGEDVGNALYDNGERTIPSWVTTHVLGDAYGYTISEPESFGSMYVNQNANTGLVTVRGGIGTSSDVITVSAVSVLGTTFLTVAVDVGDDPAGSRHLAGAGNLPAWSTTFIAGAVSGLAINGGGGTDFLRIEGTGGRPVTVNGGDGDDFIDFSFGNRNLSFINSGVTVQGGNGIDRIYVYDNAQAAAQTFTVTSSRFDRPGWGGFSYLSDVELETLTTGTAADTVNVNSTFAGEPVVVASAGGNDVVNIGSSVGGMQNINADVQIQNDPAFSTVNLNNSTDPGARSWLINDPSAGFGGISGLAPALIAWDNADINDINLICGPGPDTGVIARLSETLRINNTNGDNFDSIRIGDPSAAGMQAITQGRAGGIIIDNDPDFTDITFDDTGSNFSRTITLDLVNGYNQLSGMCGTTIQYDDGDTRHVTIRTSSVADIVNVLRTTVAASGITTVTSSGGNDIVNLGNPTDGVQGIVNTTLYVTNPPAFSTLSINDGPDATPRNVTMDTFDAADVVQKITGLAAFSTIQWNTSDLAFTQHTITFGSAVDTINILRSRTNLLITTTGGNDIATVGNNTDGCDLIGRNIAFQNPPAFTSLTVNDTGNTTGRTWTVGSTGAVGSGTLALSEFLAISYKLADTASPVTMNLGSGNDTVRFTGVDTRTVIVNGNNGDDDFVFSGATSAIVDPINVPVTVNGGDGSDELRFDNSADTTENGFNVSGNVVSHADMANVSYATCESVAVLGGTNAGTPTHSFVNTPVGTTLSFTGGSGKDLARVSNNGSPLFVRPSSGRDDVIVNHLNVAGGGKVHFDETVRLGTLTMNLNAFAALVGTDKLLSTRVLTMSSTAVLDLTSNDLILDANAAQAPNSRGALAGRSVVDPVATIQALINSARAGGTWNGFGITSSSARDRAQQNTSLGVLRGSEYTGGSFNGEPVNPDAVLVKYTYYGDTDFNGKVNFDDYARTDAGFLNHQSGWRNGDNDGDGVIDFDDYALIDRAFLSQSEVL